MPVWVANSRLSALGVVESVLAQSRRVRGSAGSLRSAVAMMLIAPVSSASRGSVRMNCSRNSSSVSVGRTSGSSRQHSTIENAATPVYLAGQNVITPHIWLSRIDAPNDIYEPDRLIVDLDPSPGVGFAAIRAAAREAGRRLRDAGLVPFAMVTGSRGVHVVCPLRRGHGFQEVHGWARALAEAMVADDGKRLTLEWRRENRGRRIYLDVNRIAYAQHAVAPYGVRARPRAPVAMPIHWEELDDSRLRPDRWTVRNASDRLEAEGDAWKGIGRRARGLPATTPG